MRVALGVCFCWMIGCASAPSAERAPPPVAVASDSRASSASPPSVPTQPTPPAAVDPAPSDVAAPPVRAACASARFERVQVTARSRATASTGLSIRHRGTSHDSFEDGRTDVMLSLAFERAGAADSWLPSILALPTETRLLGHCVRLLEASDERAVLEVGLLPPP